ncbi:T4 gp25-like baseplate wedge protein [Haloarcula virus HCTV-15]|uniref:Uncharacterized protein n=1 Tax=Halorubrum sodomense tailed virus 2 TaxID=1262527 RepID=L7TIT0_9CAUD|nr:hypothetical protein HSTV2_29 [Halorubrum sodomense tailed virus 2]AGC34298.1 hypothetical protein HSTV2_29 [Halorubrum sodomense tailed virus 2]UBF22286.1 T4 gp25-like baseplate wedge protein [Halorubrum virus HRTV-11]UBF22396.1 T4 gp25-like baseplate wedge protein [Haloarcula virus HCTV-6]UBF22503.1 T4 gp25-like baseplate wedge protein [Haloarcula virus HCTV-15]
MDLALNSDFSVFLDDRNDLAVVEGREAFEQSVVITLTDFMQDVLSNYNPDTIKSKLRLQVTRVAREHDQIQSIDYINIYRKQDAGDTYVVEVVYLTDEAAFSTEVAA